MEEKKKKEKAKNVEIKAVFPEGQIGLFSNFATIQRDRQEFHLSFFQIQPPLILGDDEKVDKTFDSIQSVEARCLVKIVMTKERIQGLITALSDQVKKTEFTTDLSVNTEE